MAKATRERDQAGRLLQQMESLLNMSKAQNRGLTASERTKFDALCADHSALQEKIENIERRSGSGIAELGDLPSAAQWNRVRDELRLTPAQRRERESDPHARAFSNYLRLGENRLAPEDHEILRGTAGDIPPEIRNAMSTTTGSQGGYLVPTGFSDMLEEAKKWFGGIEGTVDKFTTGSGNPMPWPTVNDTTNKGRIIGQNLQVSETDLVFNQVSFSAYIGSSDLVLVPLALVEDSYFDMDQLVARLLGIRLGRLYNNKCTVGSGTAEPTGIVTAAANAGNILQLTTGNTATIAYNNLVDLEGLVDPAYRENPASMWMFSDATLKLLKKLVDGNDRPLWQPGLTASFAGGAAVVTGSKPRILEHPYVINQDMATPAANAYSMLFGDMSTFKVREVVGGTTLLVLRERYADYFQIGFIAFQRFDSNLVDAGTHPLAVLQQSAT